MSITDYQFTLNAPGMPRGHRFRIPAELIPINPTSSVKVALETASAAALDCILLKVQPVYNNAPVPREPAKQPKARMRSALTEFIAGCDDSQQKALAIKLKNALA